MSYRQGVLHLESENAIKNLAMYSLDGKPILNIAPGRKSYDADVRHLATGMYIAYVLTEGGSRPSILKLLIE